MGPITCLLALTVSALHREQISIYAGAAEGGVPTLTISCALIDETTKLPPELEELRKAEQGKKAAAQNQ